MKGIIFFICLFVFLSGQARGTKETDKDTVPSKIITINPFGTDSFFQYVKFGSRVKFKISNVNTFKVNGFVASKPVNIDFEVPAIFSDILKQGKETGTQEVTPDSKKGKDSTKAVRVVPPNVLLTKADSIAQMQNDFKNCFREFLDAYQRINIYTSLEDHLYHQLMDSIFIRNTEVLKANCTSEYLASYTDTSDYIRDKKKIYDAFSVIDNSFTSIKLLYEKLKNMLKDASFTVNGTLQSADKKNSLIVKNAEVKLETKKYFEDEYSFAKKVYEQLNDVKNRKALVEKACAGIDLYNRIQKEPFICYTDSEPINADEVTLTPTLKYANGNVAKEFSSYQIRTTGGVKVNFSSGYFLSFVCDDNYTLYRDSNGNIKGASKGNSNKLTHALGAMAHVYCRSEKDYNFAFSSGISLANNSNLGFYLGGSILFSEKNRFIISTGISYVQLQKLNTANLETPGAGDKYTFISSSDNTIKYDQVYRPAFFVGITYNLSGNK